MSLGHKEAIRSATRREMVPAGFLLLTRLGLTFVPPVQELLRHPAGHIQQ
jgi:hypothetical protein